MALLIYYVYQHRRLDTNEVFYVGKGKNNRFEDKRNRNKHWHHIVEKYGYIYEILIDNIDEEFALFCEKEVISKYRYLNISLVNYTDGGEGVSGLIHSDNSRKKIYNIQRKLYLTDIACNKGLLLYDEVKYKFSIAKLGKDTWNKGKSDIYSDSTKEKMSNAKIGLFQSYFWWNNGTMNTRNPICPGEGWIKGRFKK